MRGTAYQSQNDTVLAHLQSGASITSWEAIQKWHITRLARVIDDLEKTHSIQSEWESGNGKRWKRYWIEQQKEQLEFPVFQQQAAHG